jgi:hypothetical protein
MRAAQAQIYELTPAKIFNWLVAQGFSADSTFCGPLVNGSRNIYQYDTATDNKITTKINMGAISNAFGYAGLTFNFGRNNSNDEIYRNEDSMVYKATEKYGPTIQFNNTGGAKKILCDWGLVKTRVEHEDPNERYYGTIISMICGTDTVRDTLFAHPNLRVRKTSSYTLTQTGSRTVQLKIFKHGAPYNGGNTAFFGIRVFDAATSGILVNTPCEPLTGGSVSRTPAKHSYDVGDVVQLEAMSNAGYTFTRWADGETNPQRSVTVGTADVAMQAVFAPIDYDFTALVMPVAAFGSITVSPVKSKYNVGDALTLTAVRASSGFRFLQWGDGATTNPRTYTMPAKNDTVVANFSSLTPSILTINIAPSSAAGSVTQTLRREEIAGYVGKRFPGDVVDLQATPSAGYEFVRWSDGYDDPEYAIRFESASITLTAEFRTATGNPPVPTPRLKPAVRVDLNVSGRQEKEVNEPRYTAWVLHPDTMYKTFGELTVTMAKYGNAGTGLTTSWYKTGLQAPYFARLANDGIRVDGVVSGAGQMTMTLAGLHKGTHSILLYFNVWDAPANTYTPVDIYVDEQKKMTVTQTVRAMDNAAATVAYIEFPVKDYQDVVIRLSADEASSATVKNVYLAGFELNVPNVQKQARKPSPADMDEHVNGDDGNIMLSWQSAYLGGVVKHHLYVGTDSATVAAADKTSAAYKGEKNASDTSFAMSNIYCMDTYYWRVDEEIGSGEVTQGNLWNFRPRLLAFAGAEGYGRYARGARGGKVVYVTNLNNSGAGSFREAITSNIGPRYILFAVGGKINLSAGERITLNSHYVTVAGQTAPGKGVCIASAPFGISGSKDAIVRFMRVRLGRTGITADGMGMNDANHSIMDHNSISWTIDEAFSSRNGKNFTLQRTLISEALNAAEHQNYGIGSQHGYAATIGGDTASFHHNLLAHCEGRNWSLGGGLDGDGNYAGHLDIFNNVVFNYGGRVTDGGAYEVNFVNNYYRKGPNSTSGMLKAQHESSGAGTQKYYAKGNILENVNGSFDCENEDALECGCSSTWHESQTPYDDYVDAPFFPSHATIHKAKHAFKDVLSDVGATMPAFDEHDLRVATESRDKTWKYRGSYTGKWGLPDHHLDVGGYEDYPSVARPADFDSDLDGLPSWWENEVSHTNPNSPQGDFSETNADPDRDGNTNMERYLTWMATPHITTTKGKKVSVELSQLTRGYAKSPVFTRLSDGDGTVTIDGTWARFQPASGFTGVTYFEFKVTDADGDEMVRRIGVRVTEENVE